MVPTDDPVDVFFHFLQGHVQRAAELWSQEPVAVVPSDESLSPPESPCSYSSISSSESCSIEDDDIEGVGCEGEGGVCVTIYLSPPLSGSRDDFPLIP